MLCSKSFTPLYRGKPQVKCPFCGASYMPTFVGSVCDVCEVWKFFFEIFCNFNTPAGDFSLKISGLKIILFGGRKGEN